MARILIVDDEAQILKMLAFMLCFDGHEPMPAPDGLAALKLLAEQPIDLMITDLRMAPMGGLDLFRNARARFPDLPVIILSAFASAETEREALRFGVFAYLFKPFKPDELFLTVRRALDAGRR